MKKYLKLSERLHIPHYVKELSLGKVMVDESKCSGCGLCARICPGSALELNAKKARMRVSELPQCMGCGDCAAICPRQAISITHPIILSGYYKTINRADMEPPRLFTPEKGEDS